jgi:hypothetical protein
MADGRMIIDEQAAVEILDHLGHSSRAATRPLVARRPAGARLRLGGRRGLRRDRLAQHNRLIFTPAEASKAAVCAHLR